MATDFERALLDQHLFRATEFIASGPVPVGVVICIAFTKDGENIALATRPGFDVETLNRLLKSLIDRDKTTVIQETQINKKPGTHD